MHGRLQQPCVADDNLLIIDSESGNVQNILGRQIDVCHLSRSSSSAHLTVCSLAALRTSAS